MTCLKAENPVVFIDSGIGGLPYLDDFRIKMPGENLVYFADTENFPYGTKSEYKLKRILTEITGKIIQKFDPKLIVLSCNTASVKNRTLSIVSKLSFITLPLLRHPP